ncbi:MAG: hypothetical protein RL385_968 [Pseudomonadota bacterium]|jgi:lipopolysaccharide/colanic/teichoic acid biosynthesis glycosyltransferase
MSLAADGTMPGKVQRVHRDSVPAFHSEIPSQPSLQRSRNDRHFEMQKATAKRIADVVGSGIALVVLAPVMAGISLMVRTNLGTPVLFRQERPGLGGRPFRMAKFRTMREACDSQGNSLPDEARLTRFGQVLRATSLDELPELWNVLRGDMSLVGPRPLLMEYLPRYNARQARRHDVRPGITGWAQINGRNTLSWDEKFELDLWYVENQSLSLDLKILARTVWTVIRRKGISAEGEVTMPRFMGTADPSRNAR